MHGQIFIGVLAGLASVILFGSLITGSPFAFFLFYLAALPLFIVGFGWSWPVAGIGAVTGSIAMALIGGALGGSIYAIAAAGPAVWLSYLAMLQRPGPENEQDAPAIQWYAPGSLVIWTAVIGGLLVLPSIAALGLSYETYMGALSRFALDMLQSIQQQGNMTLPEGASLEDIARGIAKLAPVATACAWMAATLANMYLAGVIVKASGRLQRPWPPLRELQFPRRFSWALLAALALSFLPGMAGLITSVFAAVFTLAYALLGLAVVHTITLGSPVRILMLGGVYFALIFMGWPVVILAALGLGEPLFKLRQRGGGGPPPPATT